jgi:hypothetical protein
MNLGHRTLEDWLKLPPVESQKKGGDNFPFFSKYDSFKHFLNENLHKEVTKSAIMAEIVKEIEYNKITYLNDHGPDHIKTVILRASELVEFEDCDLNAREVFILLNAIQVHDIGNFYGRIGHESEIVKAIKEGLVPILFDSKEVKIIKNVAEVHGGEYIEKDGRKNKGTFKSINSPVISSDSYKIRVELLAAILRFSDELADDFHRADVKKLKDKTMPKGSEIYHAYAKCLEPAIINHKEKRVELHYNISQEDLRMAFGKYDKNNDQILEKPLLEEIYERTLKVHFERIYCSKFWKKFIDIDSVWVRIGFYSSEFHDEVHPEITYTLSDSQYPSSTEGMTIFELCSKELSYQNGDKITTANVLKKISQNEQ